MNPLKVLLLALLFGPSCIGQVPLKHNWELNFSDGVKGAFVPSAQGRLAVVDRVNPSGTARLVLVANDGTVMDQIPLQTQFNGTYGNLIWDKEQGVVFTYNGEMNYYRVSTRRSVWRVLNNQNMPDFTLDSDRGEIYYYRNSQASILKVSDGTVIRTVPAPGTYLVGPDGTLVVSSLSRWDRAGTRLWYHPFSTGAQTLPPRPTIGPNFSLWPSGPSPWAGGLSFSIFDGLTGTPKSLIFLQRPEESANVSSFIGAEWTAVHVSSPKQKKLYFLSNRSLRVVSQGDLPAITAGIWDLQGTFYYAATNKLLGIDPLTLQEKFVFEADAPIWRAMPYNDRVYVATSVGSFFSVQLPAPVYSVSPTHAPNFFPGPMFSGGGVHQQKLRGSAAHFSFNVVGADSLQWFGPNGKIEKATNASLELPNVSELDAGNYFLVAANQFRSRTSAPIRLEIDVPGSVIWSVPLATVGDASPILAGNDKVIVPMSFRTGGYRSTVAAYERTSGAMLWSAPTTYPAIQPMSDEKGNVIAPNIFGDAFMFAGEDGKLLWSRPATGYYYFNLGLHRNGHIYGHSGTNLFKQAISNGGSEVHAHFPTSFSSATLILDNVIFLSAGNPERLIKVDVESGELSEVLIPFVAELTPGKKGALYGRGKNRLVSLDATTGAILWESALAGSITSIVLDQEERIFGLASNSLVCVDGKTGSTVWTVTVLGGFTSNPAAGDSEVYIGDSNILRAYDSASGQERWAANFDESIRYPPLLTSDGEMFVVTGSKLTKLHGARPVAPSSWPLIHGNPYGTRAIYYDLPQTLRLAIAEEGQFVVIHFRSRPGANYDLLGSDDLANWEPNGSLTANGGEERFTIARLATRQFFQVRER